MNRRHFLMAAGLAAAGCGGGKRPLRVFCYGGGHDETMRRVFAPVFEHATGIECELHSGWWDGDAKIRSARAAGAEPPYDLAITDATQGYPAIKDGLFAEINPDNIPNLAHFAHAVLDNHVFKERYGVPYPDSVQTLAFARAAADPAPMSWGDLVKWKGRVGLYKHFYMSLYTFACIRASVEGKPGTAHALVEKDWPGVMRFAREHRGLVNLWWPNPTEMMRALSDGRCVAGNMHSPEYLNAMRERPELAAAVPAEDRALVQVFWAVPAGSPQQALAEEAINILFSEKCQLGFARRGMATPLPSVAATMAEEDALWKSLYPHTAEQLRSLRYYPYETYAKHWDSISGEWDRTVLRAG
jgi:spermidine/putrescine-binding protein